jgi:hypothetical protein
VHEPAGDEREKFVTIAEAEPDAATALQQFYVVGLSFVSILYAARR